MRCVVRNTSNAFPQISKLVRPLSNIRPKRWIHTTPLWKCHGIRGIQNFDGRFELNQEAKDDLFFMLNSETFGNLVTKECKLDPESKWEFTEILFQPVPWSPGTPKGMPTEYEVYLDDPNYAVINIPPTVMFKAKIFNPSRLCAIFKRVDP